MSCFFLSPCEVGGEIINLVTLSMAAAEPDDYFLLGPVYSPPAWQEPRRGLLRHSMLSVQHSGPPNHYLQNGSEYFKCNELSSNMRIKRDLLGGKKCLLMHLPWLGKPVTREKGSTRTAYTENPKDQTPEKSIHRLWNAALLSSAFCLAFLLSPAFPV